MMLSIIVPCYNEEKVIRETYRRLHAVVSRLPHLQCEIIFINDGSKDDTQGILRDLAGQDASVKIINFSRNFGHQSAVTAGLYLCRGDLAVIIDADLQDPPEVIPDMLHIQEKEGCHVVYGVRKKRKGESFFKRTTAKVFYRTLNYLSEISFPVDTGDFRLLDRKVIDAFNNLPEKHKYIRGLVSWMGFKQCPVYYERDPRFAGETKYTLKRMINLASLALFYFSKKPLKIAVTLGFFSLITGLLYAAWLVFGFWLGWTTVISGWTSLVIIMIFFGGVQLLSIGILGQYIGSLFDEVKSRPEYVIDNTINFAAKENL